MSLQQIKKDAKLTLNHGVSRSRKVTKIVNFSGSTTKRLYTCPLKRTVAILVQIGASQVLCNSASC